MRTLYSKSVLRVKKDEGVKLRKVLSHQGFFNEHIRLRSEKYCLAGKGERSILMAEKNSVMTIFLQFFQVLRTEERILHFVVCAG